MAAAFAEQTRRTAVGLFPFKQDFLSIKQDFPSVKQDFDRLTTAGLSVRSTNNVLKLLQRYGFDDPFGRKDVMELLDITKSPASELLKKLLSIGAIFSVKGKGMYQFLSDFFG